MTIAETNTGLTRTEVTAGATAGLPRAVDAALALVGLVVAAPVLAAAAVAVHLSSTGPVLFLQERVGRAGRPFTLLKFRTMRVNDERKQLTTSGDPRVTGVGRVLRKFKIDELPQLWNVVRGDMALVGPRPEVARFVDTRDPGWQQVLAVRPGLTDPATLTLRNEEELLAAAGDDTDAFYRDRLLPYKLKLNADYLERRHLRTDLAVLLKTAAAVVMPGRASAPTVADIVAGRRPQREHRPIWTHLRYREMQFALDLCLLAGAFLFAYLIRFEFRLPRGELHAMLGQLPLVILLQFALAYWCGIYRYVWRYIGMKEILAFAWAGTFATVPLLLLRYGLPAEFGAWRVPLSVILLDALFAFGGMLGLRVVRRGLYERFERNRQQSRSTNDQRKPVLLVGAGREGVVAIREILARGDMDIEPVGFVDDNPARQRSVIHGLPVLGTTADLARLIPDHGIEQVITTNENNGSGIRDVVRTCEQLGVKVRVLPRMDQIIGGQVSVSSLRDVELEDLLGREPVRLDEDLVRRFLVGSTAMVTGAGGSIGSELCRQIIRFNVTSIVLVERAEGALFTIERELRELWPDLKLTALVADVCDEQRIRSILQQHRPQVIFHAAAHKHVPMMEHNPGEAVKNNVLGTRTLARLAGEVSVEAFVLISTDKAVRPTSVMGASKRIAELVIQQLDQQFAHTRFLAVRFGNVMGSAGSVIPIFRHQIEQGGPVTVTHPDMTRYFMTIPEAAQLVLEAGALGEGGQILILDMGEPVKIVDLARDMITLSGRKPDKDIEITFTGLRPGEKLFEELNLDGEQVDKTGHPKIFIGRLNGEHGHALDETIDRLTKVAAEGRDDEIRQVMGELLPEAQLQEQLLGVRH